MNGSLRVTPLIMCGGAGTRLWPASRETTPKQFITLLGSRSTFQDTIARVSDPALFDEPVIITNGAYRGMVEEQLASIGARATILLEPARRDSGPAIAAGASLIARRNPRAVVLTLAADHVVQDEAAFRRAAADSAHAAAAGGIVTFGITPDHPATGYGYIRPGDTADAHGVRDVEAFVEKPDVARAQDYIAAGYLWNSGNFLFRADILLEEYARFDASTVEAAADAVGRATDDAGVLILDTDSFMRARAISIDFAVMEKTNRARVLPVSMGWSDVGSWQAVWELTEKDSAGNACAGDALFLDASGNYVSAHKLVCVVGLDNIAVIQTPDATLVFDRAKPQSVKALVDLLKSLGRPEVGRHG